MSGTSRPAVNPVTGPESTSHRGESLPFVLFRDFSAAYDVFPLKVIDIDGTLRKEIVSPLVDSLAAHVPSLLIKDLSDIQRLTKLRTPSNVYVVTLDGGTYFPHYDFSISVTRTALTVGTVASGPYARVPRDGSPHLTTRGIQLERHYRTHGYGRPIVLCDDGIGTGQSLSRIVSILRSLSITIDRILVLVNPDQLPHIDRIDVASLYDDIHACLWLNERDLFWGLPRSGLSYAPSDAFLAECGIPYTIDVKMVQERIGLARDIAESFRHDCLQANVKFWERLELHHSRPLTSADCPRLLLPVGPLNDPGSRIVDYIRSIDDPSFTYL